MMLARGSVLMILTARACTALDHMIMVIVLSFAVGLPIFAD
jgi:hypothetical protein